MLKEKVQERKISGLSVIHYISIPRTLLPAGRHYSYMLFIQIRNREPHMFGYDCTPLNKRKYILTMDYPVDD